MEWWILQSYYSSPSIVYLCLTLKLISTEKIQIEKLKFFYKFIPSAIWMNIPFCNNYAKTGESKDKTLLMLMWKDP